MRRKQLPGLSMGGVWTLPLRPTVSVTELSYVLELPAPDVVRLLGADYDGEGVPIEVANDLLWTLAGCGLTDWRETLLLADVIAGRRVIDDHGQVWIAMEGNPISRRPLEVRTTQPDGAVELESDKWRSHLQRLRASGRLTRSFSSTHVTR